VINLLVTAGIALILLVTVASMGGWFGE
jgi:hypothetical protein